MEKSQEKGKKEWKSGDLREEKKKCSSISNLCGNDRAFPVVAFSEGAPVYKGAYGNSAASDPWAAPARRAGSVGLDAGKTAF